MSRDEEASVVSEHDKDFGEIHLARSGTTRPRRTWMAALGLILGSVCVMLLVSGKAVTMKPLTATSEVSARRLVSTVDNSATSIGAKGMFRPTMSPAYAPT
jgi:hypothetical protein